jgi:hypothetical protein
LRGLRVEQSRAKLGQRKHRVDPSWLDRKRVVPLVDATGPTKLEEVRREHLAHERRVEARLFSPETFLEPFEGGPVVAAEFHGAGGLSH